MANQKPTHKSTLTLKVFEKRLTGSGRLSQAEFYITDIAMPT
jgi:hypothetical protein